MLCVCYYVEGGGVNIHVDELNDVWMVQLMQNVDLLNYLVVVSWLHVLLMDDLDSHNDIELLVDGKSYFGDATCAYGLTKEVLEVHISIL